MANAFDQFDAPAAPASGGNAFDQFDNPQSAAPSAAASLVPPIDPNTPQLSQYNPTLGQRASDLLSRVRRSSPVESILGKTPDETAQMLEPRPTGIVPNVIKAAGDIPKVAELSPGDLMGDQSTELGGAEKGIAKQANLENAAMLMGAGEVLKAAKYAPKMGAAAKALLASYFATQGAQQGATAAGERAGNPNMTPAEKGQNDSDIALNAAMVAAPVGEAIRENIPPKTTGTPNANPQQISMAVSGDKQASPAEKVAEGSATEVQKPAEEKAVAPNATQAPKPPEILPADQSVSQPAGQADTGDKKTQAATPTFQPAIKYKGQVLTGGGNGHIGIVMSHADEFPNLPSDFMGDANGMSGFVDENGTFHTRQEAADVLGSKTPMTSEDLPTFDKDATPAAKKVIPFMPKSGVELGKSIGAKFDGEFDLGTGPIKQFTYAGKNFQGDENTPHYGTTFQMPADATLEQAKAKAQEVKDRFSNQGSYSLKSEGGKFHILNPKGKVEESFTDPNEAIKALGEYNTPSPEVRAPEKSPGTGLPMENTESYGQRFAREAMEAKEKSEADFKAAQLRGKVNPAESLTQVVNRLGRQKVSELLGEWEDGARLSEDGKSVKAYTDPRNRTGFKRVPHTDFLNWISEKEKQSPANRLGVAENTKNAPGTPRDMAPAQSPELGGDQTSLKNAVADVERVTHGLPEADPTQRRAMGKAWEESGRELQDDPTAGQRIADQIIDNPQRGITDAESALLLRHKVGLGNALKAAAEKVNFGDPAAKSDFDRLSNQFKTLLDAIKERGSEWGREGRWRQALAGEDYSFQSREQILRAAKGGEPLTDSERDNLLKQTSEHQQIIEQQKKLIAEKDRQLAESVSKEAFDRLSKEAKEHPQVEPHIRIIADRIKGYFDKRAEDVLKELNSGALNADPFGVKTIAKLADLGVSKILSGAATFVKWADEMRAILPEKYHAILDKIWQASHDSLDGMVDKTAPNVREKVKKAVDVAKKQSDDESTIQKIKSKVEAGKMDEVNKLAEKLARSAIEKGARGWREVNDAVHAQLKGVIPDWDYRDTMDAISGHGKFTLPSADAISKELSEAKTQTNEIRKIQEVIGKEPVQRTGPQRRPKSDITRRLTQIYEAMKRKFGVKVTDPAVQLRSALQARKTYYTNRLSDLRHEIETKVRTVREKTASPTDPQLEALKSEYKQVKADHDAVFGDRKMSDAQRLKAAMNGVTRQITELQRRISEQDFSRSKQPNPLVESQEFKAAKAQRDALKEQYQELHDLSDEGKKSNEARSLQAAKTRLTSRISELESKLASGDFSKRVKKPPAPLDTEGQKLSVRKSQLEDQMRAAELKANRANRTKFQKLTGAISNLNRVNILSHLSVLEHLSGAALENIVTRPIGTVLAQVSRLNGTLDAIRKKAIYEGNASIRSEFKGVTGLLKSSKALKDKLFTGKSDLDWLHSKKQYPKEFLQIVQNVHGAIKEPVRQSIYARSMQLRTEAAEKMGLDPANDRVLSTTLSAEAYQDANMDIFMGDNFLSKALHGVVTGYLRGEKSSPGLAKFTADVLDILFPIVNVSTNLAIRKFRLLAGLPEAGIRLGSAAMKGDLRNKAETLTPLEAERITRAMKYGIFGIALGTYAWYHPQYFGGIYVTGKQAPTDKTTGLKTGEIALPDGGHISHHLAHGPVGGYMNMMADARRLYESDVKKNPNNPWSALSDAAFFSMYAGTRDLPAFSTIGRLASPFKTAGQKAGEMVKNIFVPGAVQDIAQGLDKSDRSPKNFQQEVASGIPGLRETVPVKKPAKR